MPTISVIVPVFKVEAYLGECIDSILNQCFSDFELILVDDGSPDRCGEICEEYAKQDARIRVIHQENQGLSGARNTGMDYAQGEYITFVDSDDVIARNYLSVLYEAIQSEQADIAVCLCHDCCDGIIPVLPDKQEEQVIHHTLYDGTTAVEKLYQGDGQVLIGSTCKLYSRAVWTSVRFPVGRLHEDQAFTPMAYYHAAKIVFTDAKLYYYRVRSDSITHTRFSSRRYDDLWAIDNCIAFFRQQGEEKIVEAALRKRQRLICVYAIYARRDGVQVLEEYRISIFKALTYLRRHVSDDKYSYYLCQVNSKLVRPHAYVRKLESLFVKSR